MPHIVYFHTNWCILNTCDGGCLYDPNYPEAPQTPIGVAFLGDSDGPDEWFKDLKRPFYDESDKW